MRTSSRLSTKRESQASPSGAPSALAGLIASASAKRGPIASSSNPRRSTPTKRKAKADLDIWPAERIKAEKHVDGQKLYLIEWKGTYPDSWIDSEDVGLPLKVEWNTTRAKSLTPMPSSSSPSQTLANCSPARPNAQLPTPRHEVAPPSRRGIGPSPRQDVVPRSWTSPPPSDVKPALAPRAPSISPTPTVQPPSQLDMLVADSAAHQARLAAMDMRLNAQAAESMALRAEIATLKASDIDKTRRIAELEAGVRDSKRSPAKP